LGSYSTFGGESVGPNDILVRYPKNGDADLDGKCGDNDVTIVGAFYDQGAATDFQWMNGDFSFDGRVDDSDVTLLGAFYDEFATPPSSAELIARFGSEFAAAFEVGQAMGVPEPVGITFLGVAAACGLRRIRRRRLAVPPDVTD
jgi:hypothetical protein